MQTLDLQAPQKASRFTTYFNSLKDPRRTHKGNYSYPLDEILFLTISAVVSGVDNWVMMPVFGNTKLSWLRKFFPYKNGIPSHDVLGKLFAKLDTQEFSKCFSNWINSISQLTKGEVVAIDGKTICNSNKTNEPKSALHVVSAYASDNKLCIGQETIAKKSNEITAIPKLLQLLELKDCIVSIDAMGCQKEIAKKVVQKKADYLLMVKNNQPGLKEQITKLFDITEIAESDINIDSGHGRIETRKCEIITDLRFLDGAKDWDGLKSIIRIESERIEKKTGKSSNETRYYISSIDKNAKRINKSIRSHWAIENNLHWSLDVLFKEDDSLKKIGNSAANFNIILKLALAMIEKEKSRKRSKPIKRMTAALDDKYREKILNC